MSPAPATSAQRNCTLAGRTRLAEGAVEKGLKEGGEAALEKGGKEVAISGFSTRYGKYVRRVDDYKHALDPDHLRAAAREKAGEIVARKADGTPFDHLTETRRAMHGAWERILLLKKYLGDPNLCKSQRQAIESELGELSRMLDNAERILGEMASGT